MVFYHFGFSGGRTRLTFRGHLGILLLTLRKTRPENATTTTPTAKQAEQRRYNDNDYDGLTYTFPYLLDNVLLLCACVHVNGKLIFGSYHGRTTDRTAKRYLRDAELEHGYRGSKTFALGQSENAYYFVVSFKSKITFLPSHHNRTCNDNARRPRWGGGSIKFRQSRLPKMTVGNNNIVTPVYRRNPNAARL